MKFVKKYKLKSKISFLKKNTNLQYKLENNLIFYIFLNLSYAVQGLPFIS